MAEVGKPSALPPKKDKKSKRRKHRAVEEVSATRTDNGAKQPSQSSPGGATNSPITQRRPTGGADVLADNPKPGGEGSKAKKKKKKKRSEAPVAADLPPVVATLPPADGQPVVGAERKKKKSRKRASQPLVEPPTFGNAPETSHQLAELSGVPKKKKKKRRVVELVPGEAVVPAEAPSLGGVREQSGQQPLEKKRKDKKKARVAEELGGQADGVSEGREDSEKKKKRKGETGTVGGEVAGAGEGVEGAGEESRGGVGVEQAMPGIVAADVGQDSWAASRNRRDLKHGRLVSGFPLILF